MAEGPEVGTAYVSIVPSAQGFGAALERQVTGQAGQAGQKAGKALSEGVTSSTSGLVKGIGGLFAVIGTARFLRGSIAEAEDAARVGRLTESVIRSTGAAAGVTARQVGDLANSLSKIAGVDDEVIQSAENVLLTFAQVRNQVGKGNDVFNQATRAALDMSAALGTDLQGAVIQLGKALQDPTQGLLALRRSGVSFTEEQQAQIKTLQSTGQLLEAQKIILSEVNKEFGGAAAAGATASQKLNVAVGNLKESLGTALLPAVNATAGGLTDLLGTFEEMPGPARAVGGALLITAAGVTAAGLAVGLLAPKIRTARAELEGLGLAGTKASAGLGLVGKATLWVALFETASQLANSFAPKVQQADEVVAELAATTDQELNKAFHDLDHHLRGIGFVNAIAGAKKGVTEFDQFNKILDTGNFALAQRIINSETEVGARQKLQAAYDKAIVQTRQLNTDQQLSSQIIAGVGNATEDTAGKMEQSIKTIEAAAKKWHEFRDSLEDVVASDWSKELASNLTSALDPMEKFVAGSGKSIDTLKDQVSTAKAELQKATTALAKFEGTATSAEIARIRGQSGDIDAARARVNEATRKLGEANTALAEAQKSPLQKIRENLKANLATITDWLKGLNTIQARLGGTAGEELAKHLGSLGPQAADAVAEAARLGPAELGKLEGLFDQADTKISEAASGAFELNLDKAAKPGETLAEIIAERYEQTLVPKFTAATLAAMDAATTAIQNQEAHGPGQRSGGVASPILGPALPAPSIGPAPPAGPALLPPGAPLTTGSRTSGITFEDGAIKVYPVTDAKPREIATEIADQIAWRLSGPARAAL